MQQTLQQRAYSSQCSPSALAGGGDFHDQTTLALPNGDEVVMLVERLCFIVYGIHHNEEPSADFRCGDGLAQCIQQ